MNETKTNEQKLQEIGKSAYESIADMVAALQCDYLRLEELREEKDCGDLEDQLRWIQENPDEAAELEDLEKSAGDCEDEDEARQRIEEDPLSIDVRSDWEMVGAELEPHQFRILLSTGGPASRIVGELNQYQEPHSARLEVQDWFQPWTEYHGADEEILLDYCRCFYFGE